MLRIRQTPMDQGCDVACLPRRTGTCWVLCHSNQRRPAVLPVCYIRPIGSLPSGSPSADGGLGLPKTCPTSHGRGPLSARHARKPQAAQMLPLYPRGRPRCEPGGEQRQWEILSRPRRPAPHPPEAARARVLPSLPARPHHARLPLLFAIRGRGPDPRQTPQDSAAENREPRALTSWLQTQQRKERACWPRAPPII